MDSDSVYFTGALHDFDRHRSKEKNKVESAKVIGRRLADYVMAVENERLIEPRLALKTAALELPTDNPFFRRAARAQRKSGSVYCELSMAMLFDLPILFSPFLISDEFFGSDRAVFDEPPVVISFAGAYAGIASAQAENGSEEGRTHFGVGEALCSEAGEYLMRAIECVSDVMSEGAHDDMS